MKYLSVDEMIKVEKTADAAGHSYADMMEAAGKGLAEVVQDVFGYLPEKRVVALIGSGNNGGDALVALDYLIRWGWKGTGLLLRPRKPTDSYVRRVVDQGGKIQEWGNSPSLPKDISEELLGAEVLLDGVLGTGFKLPIRDPLDQMLISVKSLFSGEKEKPYIVAVDCPSGVDCDTGMVDEACLPADLTVTMAGVKQGMLMFPAYNYIGELEVVDIGLPEDLPEMANITREVIGIDWIKDIIPVRPLDSHKGTFGTALIIAGSNNYPGASILAGEAAYRAGTGLVTVAVPESIYSGVIGSLPEATWLVLDDQDGGIAANGVSVVSDVMDQVSACLIGPGFGTRESTGFFLKELLTLKDLPPLVIDADGLRLVSELEDWAKQVPARSVLTPHPGEMAHLSGMTVAEIQKDRVAAAERFSKQWDQIVVLKGAHTVISEPDGRTMILISADPALARAGSGDVLGGIIVGLIAQGVPPFEAAACGAWIHSQAGLMAADIIGSRAAVLAGDICRVIGTVIPDVQ
jgi:NAD(P)H-hydrate epimerase